MHVFSMTYFNSQNVSFIKKITTTKRTPFLFTFTIFEWETILIEHQHWSLLVWKSGIHLKLDIFHLSVLQYQPWCGEILASLVYFSEYKIEDINFFYICSSACFLNKSKITKRKFLSVCVRDWVCEAGCKVNSHFMKIMILSNYGCREGESYHVFFFLVVKAGYPSRLWHVKNHRLTVWGYLSDCMPQHNNIITQGKRDHKSFNTERLRNR